MIEEKGEAKSVTVRNMHKGGIGALKFHTVKKTNDNSQLKRNLSNKKIYRMGNKPKIIEKCSQNKEKDLENSNSTVKMDSWKLIEIPEDWNKEREFETVKRDDKTVNKCNTMLKKKPKRWI